MSLIFHPIICFATVKCHYSSLMLSVFSSRGYLPGCKLTFFWHRDADKQLAMCGTAVEAIPYVSVWVPLQAVDESNGTLVLLPQTGEHGPAPCSVECSHGEVIRADSGDIVVFTSLLWHCSGPNDSAHRRLAHYANYSPSLIRWGAREHKAAEAQVCVCS